MNRPQELVLVVEKRGPQQTLVKSIILQVSINSHVRSRYSSLNKRRAFGIGSARPHAIRFTCNQLHLGGGAEHPQGDEDREALHDDNDTNDDESGSSFVDC